MDRRHCPQNRVLCLEPLEDRSLLSGMAVLATPNDEPRSQPAREGAVEVVELVVATQNGDVVAQLDAAQLPLDIAAALQARFPDAELIEAELRSENGALVYAVSTELKGRTIDVTLARDGNIIDTAQTLALGELPQPLLVPCQL